MKTDFQQDYFGDDCKTAYDVADAWARGSDPLSSMNTMIKNRMCMNHNLYSYCSSSNYNYTIHFIEDDGIIILSEIYCKILEKFIEWYSLQLKKKL